MSLFTQLTQQTPPPEKYASHLTIATSDEEPIAKAVLRGEEARTLADEPVTETTETGTISSWEHPDSSRNQALERLAQAEAEDEQNLRDWKPLTEADKTAKQEALERPNAERYNTALDEFKATHPDFDEVMAAAANVDISESKRQLLMEAGPQAVYELGKAPQEEQERFASLSDEEAREYLQTNQTQASGTPSPGRQKLDELEAESPGITELCTAAAQQLHPELLRLLDKSPFGAEVLSELALNPAGLRQILQFPPHEQAAMLTSRMWQLQKQSKEGQTQAANQKTAGNRQRLAPTRPVGGSVKGTVPMDEMSYQDYCKAREKQLKNRYKR